MPCCTEIGEVYWSCPGCQEEIGGFDVSVYDTTCMEIHQCREEIPEDIFGDLLWDSAGTNYFRERERDEGED